VENTFEKSINVVRFFSGLVMTTPTHNTPLGRIIARECVPPHHQIACGRGIFFFFLQYSFFSSFLKTPLEFLFSLFP
jgi:hypothetical protein